MVLMSKKTNPDKISSQFDEIPISKNIYCAR
jgi:hypothetical protein